MQAKHIIEAISVLDQCAQALDALEMTPQIRGTLIARCWIAANALKCYSGLNDIDVKMESKEEDEMNRQWLVENGI